MVRGHAYLNQATEIKHSLRDLVPIFHYLTLKYQSSRETKSVNEVEAIISLPHSSLIGGFPFYRLLYLLQNLLAISNAQLFERSSI